MHLRSLIVLPVLMLALPTLLGAQRIEGLLLVDDDEARPIPDAIVMLVDADDALRSAMRTDADGRFTFQVDAPGRYRLRSSPNGYAGATTREIEVPAAGTVQVRFLLTPTVVALDSIRVEGRARPLITDMALHSYHERRARGLGFAITRDEIDRQNPKATTDLLRQLPGVRVSGVMGNTSITIPSTSIGSRFCQVQVFVDGTEMNHGYRTVDDIQPRDIEGIEVFRGLASVPPELGGANHSCGVIAIWTRRR